MKLNKGSQQASMTESMLKIHRFGFWTFALLFLLEVFAISHLRSRQGQDTLSASDQQALPRIEVSPPAETLAAPLTRDETNSFEYRIEAYKNLKKIRGLNVGFGAFASDKIGPSPELSSLLDLDETQKRFITTEIRNVRRRAMDMLIKQTTFVALESGKIKAEFTPDESSSSQLKENFWSNIESRIGSEKTSFFRNLSDSYSQHPHPLHSYAADKKVWILEVGEPAKEIGRLKMTVETTTPKKQIFKSESTFPKSATHTGDMAIVLRLIPTRLQPALEQLWISASTPAHPEE